MNPETQPLDVIIIADISAVLSTLVVLPQIVKIIREPQSAAGISLLSLLIQLIAIALFSYVNLRLGLIVPFIQNIGSFLCVFLITILRTWALRKVVLETLQPTHMNLEAESVHI